MSRRRTDPIAPPPPPEHSFAPSDRARLDDVAGLRVMRRFASGTRATLLLAHPAPRSAESGTAPCLVKVFHPDTSAPSIDVELAALSARARHVVRLLDVASIETGEPPCLVLEKLPGPVLGSYLDDTPTLSAGQAVTILAPLCAALQTLHDSGVTHGALHVRRIVFDDRGAPALTGFGRGRLRESPDARRAAVWTNARARATATGPSAEESWRAAVLDDQRDLLAIVDDVLSRAATVRDRRSLDTALLLREIGAGPSRSFLPRLETLLFGLAPPEAVSGTNLAPVLASASPPPSRRTHPDEGGVGDPNAGRSSPDGPSPYDWSAPTSESPEEPTENRAISALRILGASSTTLELASSIVDTVARFAGRRRNRTPSSPGPGVEPEAGPNHRPGRIGRRPLVVGIACALVATTALLLALPSPGDEARAGAAVSDPSDAPPGDALPNEPSSEPTLPVPTDESSALLGDEPAEALRALAHVNDACTTASDVEACRVTVFQHDYLESVPVSVAPTTIDAADAVVTGSWGGSALVSARLNDQPASFLLLKGEAGWRVRDVFLSDQ
jgi:tRNA A-37 threonylcarbamoyl transferase component Bud32